MRVLLADEDVLLAGAAKNSRQNSDRRREMRQWLCLLVLALLASSCSAGGLGASASGTKVHSLWTPLGIERYEAVVYPGAVEPGPNGMSIE